MKNIKNKLIITISAAIVLAGGLFTFAANMPAVQTDSAKIPSPQEVQLNLSAKNEKPVAAKTSTAPPANAADYVCVNPLEVVMNPDQYLNKKIKFRATFDKFSTLGLDYKPALRDSQKYISFLIKRDDVKDHTIPLSEMKIFIKRSDAEKFIDLDSGDIVEVYGKVFSNALTDTWVDTDKLIVLEKKNKDSKKKA